jgi:hypothetical protein
MRAEMGGYSGGSGLSQAFAIGEDLDFHGYPAII